MCNLPLRSWRDSSELFVGLVRLRGSPFCALLMVIAHCAVKFGQKTYELKPLVRCAEQTPKNSREARTKQTPGEVQFLVHNAFLLRKLSSEVQSHSRSVCVYEKSLDVRITSRISGIPRTNDRYFIKEEERTLSSALKYNY